MESTTWLLFGAMKLDDIKLFFSGAGIDIIVLLSCIGMVVFTGIVGYGKFSGNAKETEKETANNILTYKKSIICLYLLFFFSVGSISVINTILPSTKQALALITVDLTLKNKDSIVSTGQDVLELVDGKVEKYLRILTNTELPVSVDDVKDAASNTSEALKKGAANTKKVLKEANDEVKALVATGKEIKKLLE